MDIREPFLNVKIIPPQIRAERVERQRLLKKLEGVFSIPVTLVCAPAGYGKTTLLVDWIANAPAPVVWLALSAEENDSSRFLNYFILAIQSVEPEIGKSALAAMNLPGTASMDECLHMLVNELSYLASPVALILDDYHEITSNEVQSIVTHLVEHIPPKLHLVLATRVEPSLPLARLRANSMILEVRTQDLSFRTEEINDFFCQVMDIPLSANASRQLEKQTEGWVAALQLAAISMREGDNLLMESVPLAGQHHIFDYLAEEILHRQPAGMRQFLQYTSILDRLSGPLCEAIVSPFSPYTTGAACLEALEHANLFTQALDEDHRWYRYHALFQNFLRNQLVQTESEIVKELNRKAADWLSTQGLVDEAYKHAMQGGDPEQIARLIETQARALETRGELGKLEHWLKRLPEEMILSRPQLCLASVWIAFCRLDTQSVRKYLDRANVLLKDSDDTEALGQLLAARAFLAGMTDQVEETKQFSEQAMAYLKNERHYLYSLMKLNQCFPVMMSGRLTTSVSMMEDAVSFARKTNNPFIALLGMRMLGEAYILQGKLSWAENLFLQAIDMIKQEFGEHSPLIGVARIGLGEIHHQRNELPEAEKELVEGIAGVIDWMPAIVLDGLMWLANTRQSAGDLAGARKALQQGRDISLSERHPLLDEWMLEIMIARINIMQGNLEEGFHWAQNKNLDLDGLTNLEDFYSRNPVYFRVSAYITLARLFLELGRRERTPGALQKTVSILEKILPSCQDMGQNANLMEGLLIQAQAVDSMGNSQLAQEGIHRALDLGGTERPIRIFLDEGEPVMKLLEQRRSMNLPSTELVYLDVLLSAWKEEKSKPSVAGEWKEALSFRELEVVHWMAEGKSNQEIADGLVLSLNTVKKHVSAIMGKLGAKNRSMAVIIARSQGLIR